MGDHVFLCQRAVATTELIAQYVKEGRVEIGGLITRAVERSDVGGGRPAGGVDAAGEDLRLRRFVSRHDVAPHAVETVGGRNDSAHRVDVGLLDGAALDVLVDRRLLRGGTRTGLVTTEADRVRIDPEQSGHDDDDQSRPATEGQSATTSAAAGDVACVEWTATLESHSPSMARAGAFSLECGARRMLHDTKPFSHRSV